VPSEFLKIRLKKIWNRIIRLFYQTFKVCDSWFYIAIRTKRADRCVIELKTFCIGIERNLPVIYNRYQWDIIREYYV